MIVVEHIPVIAMASWQDEQGSYSFTSSNWIFVRVEHRPMAIRLDALKYKPLPLSLQNAADVVFMGKCTALQWGGGNAYTPYAGATWPSGRYFGDGTGSVLVTGIMCQANPGDIMIIAGRLYDYGGQAAIECYRAYSVYWAKFGTYTTDEPAF